MTEKIDEVVKEVAAKTKAKRKSSSKRKITFFAIPLFALIGSMLFYSLYYTKTDSYAQKKANEETKTLVSDVAKLIMLPPGEPAIFDVQDPEVLKKQQAFFEGAEKGDKLLVYAESGKAIVYSPKKNIIVNVGPVTFDKDSTVNTPTTVTTQTEAE